MRSNEQQTKQSRIVKTTSKSRESLAFLTDKKDYII
jgi:hypothetical protein